MEKTLLSQEELVRWINSELAKYEECNDCHVTSVAQLREEDEEGCNWSMPNLRCSGVPADVCQPVAKRIIAQARDRFNIK